MSCANLSFIRPTMSKASKIKAIKMMIASFASRSVVGTLAMRSNDIVKNYSDNEMDVDEGGKDIFGLSLMVVSFIHIYCTSYNLNTDRMV